MQESPFDASRLGSLKEYCDKAWQLIYAIRKRAHDCPLDKPVSNPNSGRGTPRPEFPEWGFAKDAQHNVLSVLGGRGGGKTTVLWEVTHELYRKSYDIVLMPIQPERFGNLDTIVNWVLAALSGFVDLCSEQEERAKHSGSVPSQQGTEVDDILRAGMPSGLKAHYLDLCRRASRHYYGFAQSLSRRGKEPFEFGDEASLVAPDGYVLRDKTYRFFNELLYWYGEWCRHSPEVTSQPSGIEIGPPLVIIPLDDADLAPEEVQSIFQQLAVIVSHPRVVVLLAGDYMSFEHALRVRFIGPARNVMKPEILDAPGETFGRFVSGCVDRLLAKYLPTHLRMDIRPLSSAECLAFAPIGLGPRCSLLELLQRIPGGLRPEGGQRMAPTLADYFDLRPALAKEAGEGVPIVSPYAAMLPNNPRRLVQLHQDLTSSAGQESESARWKMLRILWKHIVLAVRPDERPALEKVVQWIPRDNQVHVELDFRQFKTGKTTGPGPVFELNQDTQVGIREAAGFWVQRKDNAGESLSDAFQSAVLFATEFLEGSLDLSSGIYGKKLGTPGGTGWDLCLEVLYKGEATDDLYWVVPDWDTYVDYFLYAEGWNHLVHLLADLPEEWRRGLDRAGRVLEYGFLWHLEAILEVQQRRQIRLLEHKSVEELTTLLSGDWQAERTCRFKRFSKRCSDALHDSRLFSRQRDSDFLNWFLGAFPWAADGILLSRGFSLDVLRLWRKGQAIVQRQRWESRNLKKEARKRLEARLLGNLSHPWTDPCIELFTKMGAPKEEFDRLQGQAEAEREGRRVAMNKLTDMIDQLVNQGASADDLKDLLNEGPNPEMLARLRGELGPRVFAILERAIEEAFGGKSTRTKEREAKR